MLTMAGDARGKPLPDEWTMNSGENYRPLQVGMEIRRRLSRDRYAIDEIVKVSEGCATIRASGREIDIDEDTHFTARGRLIHIALYSEVEYRRSQSNEGQTGKENDTMASKKKTSTEEKRSRGARSTTPTGNVLGRPIAEALWRFGILNITPLAALFILSKLGVDDKKVTVGYVAGRMRYGRMKSEKPEKFTQEQEAKIKGLLEKYEAQAEKAEPKPAKRSAKPKAEARPKKSAKPKAEAKKSAKKQVRKPKAEAPAAPAQEEAKSEQTEG